VVWESKAEEWSNGGGVSRLKNGAFTIYTTADGLGSNALRGIWKGRDGSMWFGTTVGVSRLKGGHFSTYRTTDGLLSDHIKSLYVDSKGTVWVGTYGGLNKFEDGHFTRSYIVKGGLASNNQESLP
jgi:ligand-binding sensor domain-containing protein